jgi:hypothetical protein
VSLAAWPEIPPIGCSCQLLQRVGRLEHLVAGKMTSLVGGVHACGAIEATWGSYAEWHLSQCACVLICGAVTPGSVAGAIGTRKWGTGVARLPHGRQRCPGRSANSPCPTLQPYVCLASLDDGG